MDGRLQAINRITDQLARLVSNVEIAVKSNRSDINIIAEDIVCGLLNLIYGWQLKNANAVKQNCPGVDLVDGDNCIAVQVTSTNSKEKVDHTWEEFDNDEMRKAYDDLIIVVITDDNPTKGMKKVQHLPWFSGEKDIWNIPYLMRRIENIQDVAKLQQIAAYMDDQLGSLEKTKYSLPFVPKASAAFIEGSRDRELEELKARLSPEEPLYLCGVGGIGKTELAIQLAKRYAPKSGAYFLRYTQAPAGESMRWSILQAKIDGYCFTGADDEDREAEYRDRVRLLREHFGGAILIVDNWDGDDLNQMRSEGSFQELLTLGMQLVITTRFPVEEGYPIGALEEDDLLRLMRRSYREKTVSEEMLRSLIRAVDGHTLMVDLMAKTLRDSWGDVTPEKMLDALRRSNLDQEHFPEVTSDQNRAYQQRQIYAHLKALYSLSGIGGQDRTILQCATLLPDGGMIHTMFRDSLRMEQAQPLRNLVKHGWLRLDEGLLSMHPVIREVCRKELQPGDQTCGAFLRELRKQYNPKNYDAALFWQMASCFSTAAVHLQNFWGDWSYFASELWSEVGQPQMALQYALRTAECRRQLRKRASRNQAAEMDRQLASAYNMVALGYDHLSQHEMARDYGEQALKLRKKSLPQGDPKIAASYNNLGMTYSHLGEHRLALNYLWQALRLREKQERPKKVDLASSYNNIGTAYYAQGSFDKALKYRMKGLEIRREIHADDPNHPDLAASINNVGRTYQEMGMYDQALAYELEALHIRENQLHKHDSDIANSYYNVGHTYGQMGKFREAADYLEQAIRIWENCLAENNAYFTSTKQELETYARKLAAAPA